MKLLFYFYGLLNNIKLSVLLNFVIDTNNQFGDMKIFLAVVAVLLSVLPGNAFDGKMRIHDVDKVCNAVLDYQIRNHSLIMRNTLDWTNGAMFLGMLRWAAQKGDERPYMYFNGIAENEGWELCNIPLTGLYHADNQCIAQSYINMYRRYKDPRMIERVKAGLYYIATHPSQAPLKKDDPVGKDERWSWCDALFMAPPAYAALYSITGEKVYSDYLESEFWACRDALFDSECKLYYRDCTMIPQREPNGAKMFWSRGNGWVAAGLPLIIENLPEDYPFTSKYYEHFQELMSAVIKCQDADGSWHASMLDLEYYSVPENSASSFFCFALAWGIRNGILKGEDYRLALEKGWKALVSYVSEAGRIGYVQQIGHAPVTVKAEDTENYAVGAFLMAGSEICHLLGEKPVF